MKTLKYFISIFILFIGVQAFAQTSKTSTFKVYGNCDMCKARIEKATKIEGVSKADWNTKTKILTLTYNPSKVSPDTVQKKIAAVGHDTEKYIADDKAYAKLPGCCQYR
jgi:mercuric ion binding protein